MHEFCQRVAICVKFFRRVSLFESRLNEKDGKIVTLELASLYKVRQLMVQKLMITNLVFVALFQVDSKY